MNRHIHQAKSLEARLRVMASEDAQAIEDDGFGARVETAATARHAKAQPWLWLPLAVVLAFAFVLSVHFMLASAAQWSSVQDDVALSSGWLGSQAMASALLNQLIGLMLSAWCGWLVWQCREVSA